MEEIIITPYSFSYLEKKKVLFPVNVVPLKSYFYDSRIHNVDDGRWHGEFV
jgi:hypothetical protein